MSTTLATKPQAEIMERVLIVGDLSKLEPVERVQYYRQVCESLGLNPLTKPFEYIDLDGKLTLYARKDATDQLRNVKGVSVYKLEGKAVDGSYVVTAYVRDAQGREDIGTGVVALERETGTWKTSQNGKKYLEKDGGVEVLRGEALANAMMKAETKAKRRATLSICGLGWADESEVDSIPGARAVVVDEGTGEILEDLNAQIDRARLDLIAECLAAGGLVAGEDASAADIASMKGLARDFLGHVLGKKVSEIKKLTKGQADQILAKLLEDGMPSLKKIDPLVAAVRGG